MGLGLSLGFFAFYALFESQLRRLTTKKGTVSAFPIWSCNWSAPSNFGVLNALDLSNWNWWLDLDFQHAFPMNRKTFHKEGKACSIFNFLATGFCSSYSITIVVILKFPGHRVLFIIQYHNSSSSIKISWPHGFVHSTNSSMVAEI